MSSAAAPSGGFVVKPPRVLFEVQLLTWLNFKCVALAVATLVLGAFIVVRVDHLAERVVALSETAGTLLSAMSAAAQAQATAAANAHAAATLYRCPTPDSDTYAHLASFDTWIVLGGAFAAGEGSSEWARNSYLQLLRSQVRQQTGASIELLLAAGRFNGNLTEQAAWLQTQPTYQALVTSKRGAVVIVSGLLDALLPLDSDASPFTLDEAERQLDALLLGDEPVVPFNNRATFPLVLLEQPDPSDGALSISSARAQCTGALAPLNAPTLAQRAHIDNAFAAVRALYAQLARRYGGAMLVDMNEPLGALSLASADTLAHSIWNTDCATLNNRGHIALADLLAQCFANQPYAAPSPSA